MGGFEFGGVLFGLAAALSWGGGDFSGGMAAKKTPVAVVLLYSQFLGFVLLAAGGLAFQEPLPSAGDLSFGALAGLFGLLGLWALYSGLAKGRMGVVAPLSAVGAALMPVAAAALRSGLPGPLTLAGFAAALVAVWLLSGQAGEGRITAVELRYSTIAGIGFGCFFLLIDFATKNALFWPLSSARLACSVVLAGALGVRGGPVRPATGAVMIIALAGLFDTGGNFFYALAARFGRLDVAAVVASLYPAATVWLARIFLNERLAPRQWAGVFATLCALFLISV